MFSLIFLALSLIGGFIHSWLMGTDLVRALLLYMLIISVGVQGLWAFLGHYFKSDEVAESIGWPTGSPFQIEIAWVNLGLGALGILSIWLRGNFWLATVIFYSIFLIGAFTTHLRDLKQSQNKSVYNAGPIMYTDLVQPLILIGLTIAAWPNLA